MFILSLAQHIEKGDHSHKVLHQHLMVHLQTCPGWICVVAFYSALHYVDAYLLKKHGKQNENHEDQNNDVSNLIQEIEVEYLSLYNHGRATRYDKMRNLPEVGDAKDAVEKDLERIREYLFGYI